MDRRLNAQAGFQGVLAEQSGAAAMTTDRVWGAVGGAPKVVLAR